MWSDENLILAALILNEEAKLKKKKKKRRFWVHSMLKKRNVVGEYVTLFRDLSDDETKFFEYFHMSKSKFNELLLIIEPELTKQNTTFREAITPKEKLCICLRFLATGDSFRTIAFSYRFGRSTVCNIVKEVCDAIVEKTLTVLMPTPTENMWKRIANEFWSIWNFPNCLGALDGKHVAIQAPANSGSQFFNYKKTFSIVLLALVDAQYNFIAVDIGSYGKNSDGGIFAHSTLGRALEENNLNIPNPIELPGTDQKANYVIIGDEAFPLKPQLLRPYPSAQQREDITKKVFNYRLSRARRCSENAFALLNQKFQFYNKRLRSAPQHADKIILCTCLLHNFIKEYNIKCSSINSGLENLPSQGGNATTSAFEMRDMYKDFFNSPVGALEWQMNNI